MDILSNSREPVAAPRCATRLGSCRDTEGPSDAKAVILYIQEQVIMLYIMSSLSRIGLAVFFNGLTDVLEVPFPLGCGCPRGTPSNVQLRPGYA